MRKADLPNIAHRIRDTRKGRGESDWGGEASIVASVMSTDSSLHAHSRKVQRQARAVEGLDTAIRAWGVVILWPCFWELDSSKLETCCPERHARYDDSGKL